MTQSSANKISIFEYDDYRRFLKDFYEAAKASNPKYSYRYFAKAAGYKSASAFLEVIKAEKNLSPDGIQKFAKALKLTAVETQYFESLVLFNQCTLAAERLQHAKEISRLRLNMKIVLLDEVQYRLFEHWYYTAIAEMVTLQDFKEDPKWIAKQLVPATTPHQVTRTIEQLLQLGILERDSTGKLVQTNSKVTTPDEVSSAYLANWHRECMKIAAESIDTIPRDQRDISGVYFSFKKENIKEVKALIHNFRKAILELASQAPDKDAVYQFNIQFFPVAGTRKEGAS